MACAVPTQMIILPIQENIPIDVLSSKEGQIWSQVLNIFESWPGFKRLYWGRKVEQPTQVHLHITRDNLHQHYALIASPEWQQIIQDLMPLGVDKATDLTVRHAMISEFSPNPRALGNGAPVSGTAIYLTPDPGSWEKMWSLWTSIVVNIPGCIGVTGGWMVEPVEGTSPCYVVYVGWESIEIHDAYHETKDFRRRVNILREHNKGFREYGHIAFAHSRSRREAHL
ncbi:hypothetical protein N7510_004872 [Penicillium lagena]|uniref:uncharacterized protein n=1 Tax=Penicillium lagena TaxID=94218 RepID=UPI002542430C|nr:uncharacterized protein N7510_004872 [Penicillium lagena]KAJ5620888.1 hypothetical protein N7510_004872 [Penicillium lagena]